MSPFHLQHISTLADDLPTRVPAPPRGGESLPAGAPGVLQPAAGLALVLAGGLFMAVLAVPAYVVAVRAARAHPDIHGALAAGLD
jgi:hypothetical protein